MAFRLTSDIEIGTVRGVKPNKVSWKTSVENFIDSCTITLPRASHIKNLNLDKTFDLSDKQYQFREGDKVKVSLGYNNRNELRFQGFIRNIKMGIPVELECEGYGYQLYNIIFNKTYANVTVKQLLRDLITGTDIVLSPEIPDIPLQNIRFKNATGIQVLEYLKKECHLAVYFNFNEIYVGTLFGKIQKTEKVRVGWNIVKDDDFKKKEIDKTVKIVIREKNSKGEVKKTRPDEKKYGNEKELKIKAGIPTEFVKQIVNRLQLKQNYQGYEGTIEMFLEPTVGKGMVLEVDGGMYPEKTGSYFIESISGEFGRGGGRQTAQLGFFWNGKNGVNKS